MGSKVSGKSAIFSPLKIGGGRGFSWILGKLKLKIDLINRKLKLKIDLINRKGFKYPIKPKKLFQYQAFVVSEHFKQHLGRGGFTPLLTLPQHLKPGLIICIGRFGKIGTKDRKRGEGVKLSLVHGLKIADFPKTLDPTPNLFENLA